MGAGVTRLQDRVAVVTGGVQRENLAAAHIIPRLGSPQDIAAAAAFLYSDAAFCTGEIPTIDGGWDTKGSAG